MIKKRKLSKVGVEEIISENELNKLLNSKKKLNVKLGVDPTSKDLHLGHAVVLRMLKQFQDMGHNIFLVIGDFTASIGDPAGVNKTRPVLTEEDIRDNMLTYIEQAELVIDMKQADVVYNSSWLKGISLSKFTSYAMQVSVNQLIERDDFSMRLKNNQPLSLHELIYPVVQGLDSIELKADIEIGGWDQRLNLLMARELQKKLGQKPEVIIMMKGLIGTDGEKKMSKSHDNYIGLSEKPDQMFGKLMSINDKLLPNFAEVAATMDEYEVKRLSTLHPKNAKIEVAKRIVSIYYGEESANRAAEGFEDTFSNKRVSANLVEDIVFDDYEILIIQAVTKATGSSFSEAKRLIEQGGVSLNEKIIDNQHQKINLRKGANKLRVGKHRFFSLLWRK